MFEGLSVALAADLGFVTILYKLVICYPHMVPSTIDLFFSPFSLSSPFEQRTARLHSLVIAMQFIGNCYLSLWSMPHCMHSHWMGYTCRIARNTLFTRVVLYGLSICYIKIHWLDHQLANTTTDISQLPPSTVNSTSTWTNYLTSTWTNCSTPARTKYLTSAWTNFYLSHNLVLPTSIGNHGS